MTKVKVLIASAAMALLACGEDAPTVKDAEYYSTHVDELLPIFGECEAKLEAADTVEKLNDLKGIKDENCEMAYLANAAIELGSMEKAKIRSGDNSYWQAQITRKSNKIVEWQSYIKKPNEG